MPAKAYYSLQQSLKDALPTATSYEVIQQADSSRIVHHM